MFRIDKQPHTGQEHPTKPVKLGNGMNSSELPEFGALFTGTADTTRFVSIIIFLSWDTKPHGNNKREPEPEQHAVSITMWTNEMSKVRSAPNLKSEWPDSADLIYG